MNEIEKQILEEYAINCSVESVSYEVMGKMLDEQYVKERLDLFGIKDAYIYGGTYMAVQLYRMGKKHINMKGIVDKTGKLIISENVLVVTLEEFKKIYDSEKVIVTPIRYWQQIKKDLEAFMDIKNMISIGELMLGSV